MIASTVGSDPVRSLGVVSRLLQTAEWPSRALVTRADKRSGLPDAPVRCVGARWVSCLVALLVDGGSSGVRYSRLSEVGAFALGAQGAQLVHRLLDVELPWLAVGIGDPAGQGDPQDRDAGLGGEFGGGVGYAASA